MFKPLFEWMRVRERRLSAVAMLAGFIVDNLFFGRIDLWQTHVVFLAYTAICFFVIPLFHFLQSRPSGAPGWAAVLPLATQFALGGFWSGFVIFYGRSADLGVSWPFVIFLILAFLGNEYFRQYHQRLIFTSVLFFFAIYSYAIFAVPVITKTIGAGTFLVSSMVALAVFALFMRLLQTAARERFSEDAVRIRLGTFFVLGIVLISYFTNVLPPLPLSAEAAGVYHSVSRIPGDYIAKAEENPWTVRYLGFAPTLHIAIGQPISAYTSIFASTDLTTTISHVWQKYDPIKESWVTRANIRYPIIGGRDGGYRGYSTIFPQEEGKWRVSVETPDGRRIVRLPFTVVFVETEPPLKTISLE